MGTELRVGSDGVAVIMLKNPPVNALSKAVLRDLKANYEEMIRRDDVEAIIVTGAGGIFCGGADISEFKQYHGDKEVVSQERISVDLMTHLIEGSNKPSVAAIDGLALGGGLELAMCCNARLAVPTALLGLPEQQLGIIPGYGGTQRLPRLVGLSKAVQMILLSKPITSVEGKEAGLVDATVEQSNLLSAARAWALDIARGQRPWLHTLYRNDRLEPLGEARRILKSAREHVMRASPNVRYPYICLDAIEEGVIAGGFSGLLKEEKASVEVLKLDTSKALVHFFFSQRATSKVAGVTDQNLKPRIVKKVAVVGDISLAARLVPMLVLSNVPVLLKEADQSSLLMSLNNIKATLQDHVKKGMLASEKFDKSLSLVKGVLSYDDFKDVDTVIEAMTADVTKSQQVLDHLERVCSPTCVFAINTSNSNAKFERTNIHLQGRIVGLHFSGLADDKPLLEIVRTEKTFAQVVVDTLQFGKKLKKVPLVVGNRAVSAVNSISSIFFQAATLLVDLGVDPYQVDGVFDKFGFIKGPFRLLDLVDIRSAVEIALQYAHYYPSQAYISKLILSLVEDGRLGVSRRQGFYAYDRDGKAQQFVELQTYITSSRHLSELRPQGEAAIITKKDIIEMILFPVINEATRLLHEKVMVKASDVDIASVLELGFPAYRGGLMFWADSVGVNYVYSKLSHWTSTFSTFFKPSLFLEERTKNRTSLTAVVRDPKSSL